MKMTIKQQAFVEEFSKLDSAMPRSMGLILGYLLVCQPAEQTSVDIQQALELSAGSVSNMISMLVDSGLVSRVKKTGDRKAYYLIAENSWQRVIKMRLESIENFRNTAKTGMSVADNYRMRELYNVFDFFASEFGRLSERLEKQQKAVS